MFRSSSTDDGFDPKLQALLDSVSRDVFGPDEDLHGLDFATIEQRAHEVGRRVARRLTEQAAAEQAQTAREPQPCPDCREPCAGTIHTREFITQDGSIPLQEAKYFCPRCRRAFFPQPTSATSEPSPLQSGDPG